MRSARLARTGAGLDSVRGAGFGVLTVVLGVVVGLVGLVLAAVLIMAPSAAAAPHQVGVGRVLAVGDVLRSPDGHSTARIRPDGRLVVRHGQRVVWRTHARGSDARLVLRAGGNLVLRSHGRTLWASRTAGSGANRIVLRNSGVLAVKSTGGTAWSTRTGNVCTRHPARSKRVLINLSQQFARVCDGGQQVLTTAITSGMSAYGYGTPTGTYHLNGKYRDVTLYPSSGGAYPVDFWMPYDGNVYGLHDASWQKIPFGSPKYRTRGSHGCVHVPHAAIAWLYRWAPIGTTVTISG